MKLRRFVSANLAVCLLSTTLAFNVNAETASITLTGGATAGDPIEVSITNGVLPDGTWQISSDNAEFSDITLNAYTDTAEHYAIKPGNKNKYVRYAQEIDGATIYSNVIGPLPASVGPKSNGNTETVNEAANADKVFSPANDTSKGFIVLNTSNADTDGLFVLARDAYGRMQFDADSRDRFDPDKSNNIAYKLNQLLENGSWTATKWEAATFTFPIAKEYINNHEWYTEAGHIGGYAPSDYKATTKLALLSRTEWEQYKNEIGSKPTDSAYANYTWLRTGSGNGANTVTITVNGGSSGIQYTAAQSRAINNPANALHAVRPCFYLDKSYFLNNKINAETAGSEVKSFITSNFTAQQLKSSAGYTDGELDLLGFDIGFARLEGGVVINTAADVTTEIVPVYTKGANCDDVVIKWYISQTQNGSFSEITLSKIDTADCYHIKPSDSSKYLKCTVFPVNDQGEMGAGVDSNVIGPLPASVGPISNGNTETVNEAANANKVFSPANDASKGFIVLNTSNADTDGLFVLARDAYGRVKFDDDSRDRFDPDKSNNIAYKLNQLLENGSWTATKWEAATFTFPIAKNI